MIIKYYGYGHMAVPSEQLPYVNAAVLVLKATSPEMAARNFTPDQPSACVWMVPGTFNVDGRNVE